MTIHVADIVGLDRSTSEPLYRQLYKGLRKAILRGQLLPDTQIPSTRTLADQLGVSRNTVRRAFEKLHTEGYLEQQVGSGTYVSSELPDQFTQVDPSLDAIERNLQLADTKTLSLSQNGRCVVGLDLSVVDNPEEQLAFRPGLPALDAFPIETWSQLASRRWRCLPPTELIYGDPAGYGPLREAVAKYLRTARGVRCEAGQVIIVSGVQHGIMLAAHLLLNPGDSAYVEDPSLPTMSGAFIAAGASPTPVPVDKEGFNVSAADADLDAQIVGVTPSHQFPLGTTMSLARRVELLEWATQNETWILENDYDSEYRYAGRPIAALQGLDNAGRVIYTGTFSKVLFPALRLGYLVVPSDLVEPFVKMRSLDDRCPPRVSQMILTDFITEGYFEEHIRQMRALYSSRQDVLLNAIDEELKGFIDASSSEAGFHLVGWLPEGIDDRTISERLAKAEIVAPPLSFYSFYSERPLNRGGLLLGYAGVPEEKIRSSVKRMAEVLKPYRLMKKF